MTAIGHVVGTLRSITPERLCCEGDARGDIYALGLTLYELLTLRLAYDSSDRLKRIEPIKAEEPAGSRSLGGVFNNSLSSKTSVCSDLSPNGADGSQKDPSSPVLETK